MGDTLSCLKDLDGGWGWRRLLRSMQMGLFGQPVSSSRGRRRRNLTLDVAKCWRCVGQLEELPSYSRPKSPHLYTTVAVAGDPRPARVPQTDLSRHRRGPRPVGGPARWGWPATAACPIPRASRSSPTGWPRRPRPRRRPGPGLLPTTAGRRRRGGGGGRVGLDGRRVLAGVASLRTGDRRRRYVKLSLAVACTTLLLVTFAAGFGPTTTMLVMDLLWRTSGVANLVKLYACTATTWRRPMRSAATDRACATCHRSTRRWRSCATRTARRWRRDLIASGYGRRWRTSSRSSASSNGRPPAAFAPRTDAAMLTEGEA